MTAALEPEAVDLGPESMAAFVEPGRAPAQVEALFLNAHHANLVRLVRIRAALGTAASETARQARFEDAFAILAGSPVDIQRRVLSHPAATIWLQQVEGATDAGRLAGVGRFALAALALQGKSVEPWHLRADGRGRVSLSGSGRYLDAGPQMAGTFVQVDAADGDAWRRVPTPGGHCELNAIDEELRSLNRDAFSYMDLSDSDILAWESPLAEAWGWIRKASPLLGRELDEGARAIVPILSRTPRAHASATFREAPGLIAMSRSNDASVLAEAIVHEYHHTKLNVLLNVAHMGEGLGRPVHYSPWRTDPRPLLGILHGAFTFQAILRFWAEFREAGLETLAQDRLDQRMFEISRQVAVAVATLRDHAKLTEMGVALVDAIDQSNTETTSRIPKLDERVCRLLEAKLAAHRRAWEAPSTPAPPPRAAEPFLNGDALEAMVLQATLGSFLGASPDLDSIRRYYRRYTIPVLEATGYLDGGDATEAATWGAIQLMLSLHLRHLDYVVDGQVSGVAVALEVRQAQSYLDSAQALLRQHSSGWTGRHAALYRQFLDYEVESREAELHDVSTLWRRASTLCMVLELELAHRVRDPRLIGAYRRYLSTSLLYGDCFDAWKDLVSGPPTPVTHLLDQGRPGRFDFGQAAAQIDRLRRFTSAECESLAQTVESLGCPRWAQMLRDDAKVLADPAPI